MNHSYKIFALFFCLLIYCTQDINNDDNTFDWPSSTNKWTKTPKKGWDQEGIKYFDNMVRLEEEDRKKYKEYLNNNHDVERIDIFHCDEDEDSEDEILVNPEDVFVI